MKNFLMKLILLILKQVLFLIELILKTKEKEIDINNPNIEIEEKEINGKIILNGIIKKHNINKCFICDKPVNNIEENKEVYPVNVILLFVLLNVKKNIIKI